MDEAAIMAEMGGLEQSSGKCVDDSLVSCPVLGY
jgi:hypothetical protein